MENKGLSKTCSHNYQRFGTFLDVGVYLECLGPVSQKVGNGDRRYPVSGIKRLTRRPMVLY